MKHSRFSEEQIIAMLKENEAGTKVDDLCRRHGVSGATFYAWRKKFGGMEPSDAKRLRELETETPSSMALFTRDAFRSEALPNHGITVKSTGQRF